MVEPIKYLQERIRDQVQAGYRMVRYNNMGDKVMIMRQRAYVPDQVYVRMAGTQRLSNQLRMRVQESYYEQNRHRKPRALRESLGSNFEFTSTRGLSSD